tara:strand:+ start:338 stop:577 length:240 start_codon:yes stop_codon:yes gene_type:complete
MRKNDHEIEYLTFSEIKEEYPKEAADWNWTAKMFNYYSQGGLIQRRYNYSIKRHEYDKKSLLLIMQLVNKRLDDRRMNP